MVHLPAHVTETRARQIAERGLWWNIFRGLERLLPTFRAKLSTAKPLPHLELIWMPYYVIEVDLEGPRGADSIRVTIDGYQGQFSVYPFEVDVREAAPPGPVFPPSLSEDEAIHHAQRGVLNWLLLHQRKRRMTPTGMRICGMLRYPFWVYYYQRRRGLLDLRIVDAVTGELPGSKTKHAIVRAFQTGAETEEKGQNT